MQKGRLPQEPIKMWVPLLATILAFNAVDRLALGVTLQNIKLDLHLSDTQLGTLSGIAFALFYSTMGIPIARMADRGNRVTIISVTTALWSVLVILSALSGSFMQLLLFRICIAVGEAGCMPPALSLIADRFSRQELPKANSRYLLGIPLSGLIGYFVAGWINQLYGWRITFVVLGAPGIFLGLLAHFALSEPRFHEGSTNLRSADSEPTLSFIQSFKVLWKIPSYRNLLFSLAILSFFNTGISKWQPSFFIRTYHATTGEIGTWFASTFGIAGIVGALAGGSIASKYAPNNERLQLTVVAVMYAIVSVVFANVYLAHNKYVSFALIAVVALTGNLVGGPIYASLQSIVPRRLRAQSISIIFLFSNLIGMGLGPLAAGIISDSLHHHFGDDSLRYALLLLTPGYLIGAFFIFSARTTVQADIEKAKGIA